MLCRCRSSRWSGAGVLELAQVRDQVAGGQVEHVLQAGEGQRVSVWKQKSRSQPFAECLAHGPFDRLDATAAPDGAGLRVRIQGTTLEGKEIRKTVLLPLGATGDGAQRIARAGLSTTALPDRIQVMAVGLKSPAAKAGFEQGFNVTGIEVERPRPAKEWLFVPALVLLAGIMWRQDRRRRPAAKARTQPAVS